MAYEGYRVKAGIIGGRFKRPFDDELRPRAGKEERFQVTVSGATKFDSTEVSDFHLRSVVRFARAYAYVTGNQDDEGRHQTLATTVIEGLNVGEVVTADRVVARLESTYPAAPRSGAEVEADFIGILVAGSRFENLRILGCAVTAQPDPAFETCRTVAELEAIRKVASGQLATIKESWFTGPAQTCSLLPGVPRDPRWPLAAKDVAGSCSIRIDGFGTIHLAEYAFARNKRRLAMMRLELGSPIATVDGGVEICVVEGNGIPP